MKIVLECISGKLKGSVFELEKGKVTIGRLTTNEWIIPPEDVLASRRHAVLVGNGKQFFIMDQKSTNGTFLNGKRLFPLKQYSLKHGDKLRIGSSTFLISIISSKGKSQVAKNNGNKVSVASKPDHIYDSYKYGGGLKVLEKIATGGMSRIYKAVFKDTGEIVAIKLPKPEYRDDAEVLKLFKKEIAIGIRLHHKNIISTLYAVKFEGMPTMVMEFFPSIPLTNVVRSNMPFKKKLSLFYQTCDALAYVHKQGLVHNDIKPGNILLNKQNLVKIIDFGTAGTPASLKTIKDEWKILGTLLYMSPEQVKGKNITFKSDIYSLGIVLYELLTGVNPFRLEGKNSAAQIMERQLTYVPSPPSEVNTSLSKSVDAVILKALSKDPSKRYENIIEFKEEVKRAF